MDALLKQCDAIDGVADGMISDPLACHFDPAVLACKPGQSDTCIAPEKVAAIKKAFAGPKNAYGTQIYPGFLYDTGITSKDGVPGLLAMGEHRPVRALPHDHGHLMSIKPRCWSAIRWSSRRPPT